MSRKRIYFMGILTNTNSSILNVSLDHEFKIVAMSSEKATSLVSTFENIPYREAIKRLYSNFPCINSSENKMYYISNTLEDNIEMNDEGILTDFPSEVGIFDNNLVNGYLEPKIRLMRLFKEGNISMPLKYYFFEDDKNLPKCFMRTAIGLYLSRKPIYIIEGSEIADLQNFIQNINIPFTEPFLQLAFENFELSYNIHNRNLAFLSLMIGLETLFHPSDKGELRYRISRNIAVLLGRDHGHAEEIYNDMRDLYDKRSKIVHTGKSNACDDKDLLSLRHYLRESIKEINRIGTNKESLLYTLNSLGFGDRPLRGELTKGKNKVDLNIEAEYGTISHKLIQLPNGESYKCTVKPSSRKLRQYSGHISIRGEKKYIHIEDENSKIIQDTELPEDCPKCNFKDIGDRYYAPNDVSTAYGTTAFAAIPKDSKTLENFGIKQTITHDGNCRVFENFAGTSLEIYLLYIKKEGNKYNLDWERMYKVHREKDH